MIFLIILQPIKNVDSNFLQNNIGIIVTTLLFAIFALSSYYQLRFLLRQNSQHFYDEINKITSEKIKIHEISIESHSSQFNRLEQKIDSLYKDLLLIKDTIKVMESKIEKYGEEGLMVRSMAQDIKDMDKDILLLKTTINQYTASETEKTQTLNKLIEKFLFIEKLKDNPDK